MRNRNALHGLFTSSSALAFLAFSASSALAAPVTYDIGSSTLNNATNTTLSGTTATTNGAENQGAYLTGDAGFSSSTFTWDFTGADLTVSTPTTPGFLSDVSRGRAVINFDNTVVTGQDEAGIKILTTGFSSTILNINNGSQITGGTSGATAAGIYIDSSSSRRTDLSIDATSSVTNGGGAAGIDVVNSASSSTFSNAGTVSGGASNGYGMYLHSGALLSSMTNDASGTITGGSSGSGAHGVVIESNNGFGSGVGTFTNNGSITGGSSQGSAVLLRNTGAINSFSNSGDIQAGGGISHAVSLIDNSIISTFVNQSGGTITGGSSSGSAVYLRNNGQITSFTNAGTITSGGGLSQGISLTDNATISTLTNTSSGVITSGTGIGDGITLKSSASIDTIDNHGGISGGNSFSFLGYGIQALSNSSIGTINNYSDGTISGGANSIRLSRTGSSSIVNTAGTLTGNVLLGSTTSSGDTLNIYGGTITGHILGADNSGNYGTVNFELVGGTFGTGGISGSGSFSTDGDIGQTNNRFLAINVDSGTLTLNNNIYATTTTIADGATLLVGATNQTMSTDLVNNGTLDLGINHLSIDNNISGSGRLLLTIQAGTGGSHGYITNSGGNVNLASMTIVPSFNSGDVAVGEKLVIVDGPGTLSYDAYSMQTLHGIAWSLSQSTSGSTDYHGNSYTAGALIATAYTLASSVNYVDGPGVNALSFYSGSDSDILNLQSNLTSSTNNTQAGAQLRPDANGGGILAALGASDNAHDMIALHLSETGASSGEATLDTAIWTQAFGSSARQNTLSGVNGFENRSYGATFGADKTFDGVWRVGAAFTYAQSDVNDKGVRNGSGEDIDSYIGNVYGRYNEAQWYIDSLLILGLHQYDTKRLVNFTGSTTALGEFDSQHYGAAVEVGKAMSTGSWTLTPYAGFAYDLLLQDGYTETGAGGASLTVDSSVARSYRGTVGARIASLYNLNDNWNIKPFMSIGYKREFNDDLVPSQDVGMTGGGIQFATPGLNLPQNALLLGIGTELLSANSLALKARYDGEYRSGYINNAFLLTGRFEF